MTPVHRAFIAWRKVRQFWQDWRPNLVAREDIPINRCVHYCGFRYGSGRVNLYENYISGLASGIEVAVLRQEFISFLQYYRPRHLGEALRIELSKDYPLLHYPWMSVVTPGLSFGWFEDPDEVPDLLTQFSKRGIPMFRIEQEFYWLHRAYERMKSEGYQPERYKCHAQAWKLESTKGDSVYLLLDGNHRASALHVLGVEKLSAEITMNVREAAARNWPGVKKGLFTLSDSLAIFQGYFRNFDPDYSTTDQPAALLDDYCHKTAKGQRLSNS